MKVWQGDVLLWEREAGVVQGVVEETQYNSAGDPVFKKSQEPGGAVHNVFFDGTGSGDQHITKIEVEDEDGTKVYASSADLTAGKPSLIFDKSGRVIVGCQLVSKGTKPALVETATYGWRLTYAEEAADVYFFDRGEGQLANGSVTIDLEAIFLETVTIDGTHPMRVQVTLTGDCNGVWVEKGTTNFTVHELNGGTSNATFDWEVAAKRKGYETVRLESYQE